MEIDHIDRNHLNDLLSNLMLLHLHCHDQKTGVDGSTYVNKRRSTYDKGQTVEEPDDSETVMSGSEDESDR